MKKVFLTLMMLLFAFTGVMRAGVDVEVGMASTTNSYLPDYTFYDYAVSQQIYTASEIGMGGTINAISFDVASGSATRSLKVYMKHVTKSVFGGTSASDWAQFTASDVLFEGSVTWAAGWVTITLDTPFEYNGTDNLLVCVQDATGSYVSSQSFRVYSASNAALRVYRDGTPYDISNLSGGSRINYKNHIKLNMELGPANIPAPQDVALGARPNGAWMKPASFTLSNGGNNAIVTAIEASNNYFVVNTEVPFAVNFGEPVEVEVSTGSTTPGDVTGKLYVMYQEDRTVTEVNVSATAYDPVDGDVWENAIPVNEMPYTGNAPTGIYKNYDLPQRATADLADAVYQVTFDEDVLFSAGSPEDDAVVALYKDGFEGIGGPDVNNNYVYNGPEVGPGPLNMWFSYAYTGTNTWYGTSAGGGYYFGYQIPVSYIEELGLAGTTITNVEAAAREAYPYECYILEGGSNPGEASLIGYGVIENTTAQYYFDINLEVPAYISGNNNIWVIFYSDSPYAAYCGKNAVDVNNAKIWTLNPNATSPAWGSNTTYTPVIYTRFLELPTGREVTVDLGGMKIKEGNGTVSEVAAIDGTAMGTPKAEMKKANRGNRDVQTVLEEGFEGGSMPDGWTQTGEGNSVWYVGSGDYSSSTGAATGTYNALITHGTSGSSQYLVTPAMDLSNATSATVTCNYINRSWAGDTDGFGVYYRVNGGAWNELMYTTTAHSAYTALELDLEGLAADYQIGFRYYDSYGYGVALDDVVVTADITSGGGTPTPEPPTATYQLQDMFVPAGTYYLAIASATSGFQVDMAVAEIPVPEQAVIVSPSPGETNVVAPYFAEWILGDYTTEMQVLVGTQYPPQTALIDWTSDLVESAFLTGLEPNKNYFMQVNARNAAGTTMGEVIGFSTPIDPVEGFAVAETELYPGDVAEFSWEANTRTLIGYNLYKDGELVNVDGPITATEYAVEDLEYNMTGYNFQITAVYGAGESDPSEAIKIYMTGTTTISGTVYDQDSVTVIPNAAIEFRGIDEYDNEQVITATADENGAYTCEVLVGQFTPYVVSEAFDPTYPAAAALTVVYDEPQEVNLYTHESYFPLGMIIATEEENDVLVEWDWTPASLIVDFETGDFSQAEFTLPATYPWVITTTNPYEGTYCMKSACEGVASATSEISATIEVPFEEGKMSFYVRTSSESNYDKFHFYIDGVEQGAALSGNNPYAFKEYSVSGGVHTYKWQYTKDSSVNSNDDCIYVDNITMYRQDIPLPPVQGATVYNFDDQTMMGWTSIDADGDGNGWVSSANPGIYHNSGVNLSGTGNNASEAYVISGSYANQTGQALTPNNYLVSPTQISAENGAQIQFWACAQDASYAAEHFGVAVSTTTATAAAFTTIQEWTMTAKGPQGSTAENVRDVRGTRQGSWYMYTVDLSAYAGQDIWVAIRHFNCTDMFILNVDDITLADGSAKPMVRNDRTFQGFNLYRRDIKNVEDPEQAEAELITSLASDVFSYTDNTWPTLEYGMYQWGIQATYEGNAPEAGNRDAFTYGFENGLEGWTGIVVNTDGGEWIHSDDNLGGYDYTELAHTGTGFAMCYSYVDYVGAYNTDAYMVSPQMYSIDANSTITFWADNANDSYPENFSVCVSTAANPSAADFVQIWNGGAKGNNNGNDVVRHQANRYQNWRSHEISLSAYAGQNVWIAFHDVNYDQYEIWIDDVTITAGSSTPTPTPTPTPVVAGTGLSEILWSNVIEKDMETTVTVNVMLNNNQDPTGAVVTFEGNENYTATVDATGTVVFENFRKGTYMFNVALDGYALDPNFVAEVTIETDNWSQNVILYEIIAPVEDLYVSPTGWAMWTGGTAGGSTPVNPVGPSTTWTDDFEDASLANWTTIDADGDGDTWQNATPAAYGIGDAHSGTNCASSWSWNNYSMDPDNYMISPLCEGATSITYYVATNTGYPDHYGVIASSTGTNASDFTVVFEETAGSKGYGGAKSSMTFNGGTRDMSAWAEKTVQLPAGTKYVGFRHWNSYDMNYLFIDDVTITMGGAKSDRTALSYKVKLDGTYEGETAYPYFQHDVEGMEEGSEHLTEVAAVYATGVSGWEPYTWTYTSCENYAGLEEYDVVADGNDVTVSWTLGNNPNPNPNPNPTGTTTYDFDDGTMQGWTTIDANNDGYDWVLGSQIGGVYLVSGASLAGSGHNSSADLVCSGSYSNATGTAITPNNFLVSPAKAEYTGVSFWACGQDASYVAEHFGVAVSTGSNTNASDFTIVQEWTMTAKGEGAMSIGRDGQTRAQGSWHEYTVDLSAYAGQEIWVAIRHFNCTDMFILDVDDITLNGSAKGNRATWDLVASLDATSGYQYGVATDGTNIYTSSWSASSTSMFYKYDMQGNFLEEFNISGCGQLRDMTYDGQYFYGVANATTIYCVDLANHTLVSTTAASYGQAMRGITYDPVRDGFWVIGNWTGDLKLLDRTGAVVQTGGTPTSASGLAYYKDTDNVEHIYYVKNSQTDANVYDYNITTNTMGTTPVHNCFGEGGWSGSSGGCFVAAYDGKTCFFADAQQSPQKINIYELDASATPTPTPTPTGDVLGVYVFRDGELISGLTPVTATSFVDEDVEAGEYEYCVRVVYSDYAMSCPECETVEIGEVSCDPVTNLTGEYMVDPTYGPGVLLEWEGNANGYEVFYNGTQSLGTTTDNSIFIYGFPGDGNYLFGIVAIYDDCESDMETVTVYYDAIGENEIVNNIYPNPTNSMVTIEAQGMNHITVANALGQVVYDADVDADHIELNLGQYNAGLYLVRVSTVNGVSVKRVTVVK